MPLAACPPVRAECWVARLRRVNMVTLQGDHAVSRDGTLSQAKAWHPRMKPEQSARIREGNKPMMPTPKKKPRPTRRRFLHAAASGAAMAALGGACTPAASRAAGDAAAPGRPNILWITCEDISANLGCYGDAFARTPTLDALAARGVRYTRAFGVTGVCAPNRSCLITGVYPSSLGSHDMRCTTRLPACVKCFPEYLRRAGYYCTNNSKTDYNFPTPKTAWDECSRKAHYKNRAAGQPFFAVFNYTLTHESRIRQADKSFERVTARLTAEQRHDPAKVPVPPYHPLAPEVRRDWARYHDLITALDCQVAARLKELDDAGLAGDTIVFFFSDHGAGMPGVKKWIWRDGLHVPLLAYFPEKYRAWAPAAAGEACDRLVSFVDFAPTVLSLAGVPIPEHMQGSAFLGPSTAEPRTLVYSHRDRMAERYDTVRGVIDGRYHYLRNFMPHLTWSQFVSYTEAMPTMKVWRRMHEEGRLDGPTARYFLPAKPVEELYDMQADPHEVRNLAGNPAHRPALERLRAACTKWMRDAGDLGLMPEYERQRRSEGATPWQIRLDPDKNPVARLQQAADLANAMDPANLDRLIALLADADPVVRWWGAVGLVALGPKAAPAEAALRKALADASPNVRVAAAEAMAHLGHTADALEVLQAALAHETPFIRLRALNVLDRMGEAARPALEAMKKARIKGGHVAGYVGRMVQYVPEKFKK